MDVEMRKVKFSEYFKNRIKDIPFAVMCALYMAFCVGCMIYSAVELGERDALLAVVYMIFIPAVFVFEYLIGFRVGYILTVLIIFSACGGLLGSSYNIYMILPWFDSLLHAVSGIQTLLRKIGFRNILQHHRRCGMGVLRIPYQRNNGLRYVGRRHGHRHSIVSAKSIA